MTNEQVATRLTNYIVAFFSQDISDMRREKIYDAYLYLAERGHTDSETQEEFRYQLAIAAAAWLLYSEREIPAIGAIYEYAWYEVLAIREPAKKRSYRNPDTNFRQTIADIILGNEFEEYNKKIELVCDKAFDAIFGPKQEAA